MEQKATLVPVGQSIFWGQTATGIFWIGAGISGMFNTLLTNILFILFLSAGVVSLVKVLMIKGIGDDGDEMSEYNYTKAKATAGTIMNMILCICSTVSILVFTY